MNSPTISIFLPDLRGGGAERMMVHLANEFSSRDVRTDLVLSRFSGPYRDKVSDEVRVVDLQARRYPGYAAMGAFLPLRRYIKEEQPKTLLSALTRANVVALLAHRTANVGARMVVSERNHLSSIAAGSEMRRMRFLPYLVRGTYHWANAVVPISQGVASDLLDIASVPCEDVEVIYNPVVTDLLFEQAQEPVTHPWFDENEIPTLLGVGRLTEQKDFPTLLRAFERIRERRQARLIILGEGEKRPQLQSTARSLGIADYVDFPGFVDNPYAYMRRADAFVLSSAWEGFGNVLVEAMACGTPVVSTNCPSGPAEILEHGRYGPLVPVGDDEALADAIFDMLENPPDPEILIDRAKDFHVSTVADRYLDVLLPGR